VESVQKVLAAHTSSRTVGFLNSLFRMTEEAAQLEEPLKHKVYKLLTSIREDDDAPTEFRTLVERLLQVLAGEQDKAKLTAGLPTELGEEMNELLSRFTPPS